MNLTLVVCSVEWWDEWPEWLRGDSARGNVHVLGIKHKLSTCWALAMRAWSTTALIVIFLMVYLFLHLPTIHEGKIKIDIVVSKDNVILLCQFAPVFVLRRYSCEDKMSL